MSNRPSLKELLIESTKKQNEEREFQAQVQRIGAAVQTQLAKRAETSKPMSCPHCGEPLPESWRPSEETSGVDNDDDVKVGDGAQVIEWDNKVASVKAMIRSLVPGSTMR